VAKKDTASLNGVEYFLVGPVISQPVSDFAATFRIGEPTYETRQGASYLVIDDLSGGPGIIRGLAREDLARYSNTTGVDTRFARQATVPLAAETGTAPAKPDTALATNLRTHLRRTDRAAMHVNHDPLGSGATVYDTFAYAHKLYYQKPSQGLLTWSDMDVTLDCILDMATDAPPTGALKGKNYVFVVGKTGWRRIELVS